MSTLDRPPRVACFATQGSGSQDEDRIKQLLAPLAPDVVPFQRGQRVREVRSLIRRVRELDPDVVVMEGTGIAGGAALLAMRAFAGQRYVVSSGDAVAPFLGAVSRPLGLAGLLYEVALCRLSSGFIGWSPYLVGRALTFGAPRSLTAANWADHAQHADGLVVRDRLGIPADALVFGIVGALNWSTRYGYCYGYELIRAALEVERTDIRVLIVGDGDGRRRLCRLAGRRLDETILLPGAVPRAQLPDYLAAIDVASLPQSVDGVGSFRYTTKISEYLNARLPIITGQIPLAYDLDEGWLWRMPGDAPWDPTYLTALTSLMAEVSREEARERRPPAARLSLFDGDRQQRQVTQFVSDVVERERRGSSADRSS